MPPPLGILGTINTLITRDIWGAVGGRSSDDDTSASNTSTPPEASTTGSHAPMSHEDVEEALGDEVIPDATKGSGKRVRGSESDESTRKKVKTGPSAHDRQLMGDYDTPSTAKPIPVPTNKPDTPRPADKKTMGAVKNSHPGAFKPMNTLCQTTYAAAKPGLTKKPHDFYTGTRATQRLDTEASVGGNVPFQKIYITGQQGRPRADRFESAPAAKRQKTGYVHDAARLSSPVIDITGDNNEQSVRQTPRSKGIRQQNPFSSEFDAANQFMESFEKSARRRKRNGRNSSSSKASSVSVSEVEVVSTRSSAQPGSRQSPVVLVNRDEARQHNPKAPPARRQIDQTGTQGPAEMQSLPKINLGAAVDDYEDCFHANPGESGGSSATKQRQHITGSRDTNFREFDGKRFSFKAVAQKGAQVKQRAEAFDANENVRGRFIRDDQTRQQSQKLRHKMRDAPAQSKSQDDLEGDSSDELQGATTVNGTSSRGATLGRGKASLVSSDTEPSSKFKRPARGKSRSVHQTSDDILTCQIAAFYCIAGNHKGDGLELKYDDDDNRLEMYRDGVPVPLPGTKGLVGLDQTDIKRIDLSKGIHSVVLYGRCGKTCISFADPESFRRFCQCISTINERLVWRQLDGDMFKTCYRNVVGQIQDQQKREAEAERRLSRGQQFVQPRAGSDDEEIQYEQPDEEERAPKRRAQMHAEFGAGDLRGALKQAQAEKHDRNAARAEQETKSPYFLGRARRSSRQQKAVHKRTPTPETVKWTEIHKPKPWPQPVTYPAQGLQRVTVDFADLQRLDEGELLNDNVVCFALRQLEEKMNPKFKDQVHWFSSFFYTTLSTKNKKKVFNYDGVKRWTKNKDLLSTPYVVVPICQEFHWYVCIICNLDKLKRTPISDEADLKAESTPEQAVTPQVRELQNGEDVGEVASVADAGQELKGITNGVKKQSLSDRSGESSRQASPGKLHNLNDDGEAGNAADDDEIKVSIKSAANGTGKRRAPTRTYDSNKPLIITLDSLGYTHNAELRTLKDYVCCEAEAKREIKVERDALQGLTAKGLPEQTNFCDCGIYVIGYMEQFVQDPARFVEKVASRRLDREEDFASFDPNAKRKQIRDSLLALQKEQENHGQEKKTTVAVNNPAPKAQEVAKAAQRTSLSPEKPFEKPRRSMKEPLAEGRSDTRSALKPTQAGGERSGSTGQSAADTMPGLAPGSKTAPTKDDELEMAVPTALPRPNPSSRPTASPGKPLAKNTGPFVEFSDGEDDVLDHGGNSSSGDLLSSSPQASVPAKDESLLNGLERYNKAGLLIPRQMQAANDKTKTVGDSVTVKGPDRAQRLQTKGNSPERSYITIDDSQDGSALVQDEIADSQEPIPKRESPQRSIAQGRHTKFED
ncbi:hypothetical protein EJ03DRAFT_328084 [Teratosphaeria nubilosa]|uniref:Ubiquitin-like protease family profile domain-containing protein n=1 Tax=Teratosphaeria nubilosa TaxID=161662 RepID=A0A6G1L767_9PEZI|nr:hypothetical protein EJ03DRAFT_328084 [Teratosphaeria nubilosa]